jgi:general secretion pathway protein A
MVANAFSISPNPNLLFETPGLKNALFKTRHVLDNKQGLTMLLGPVGTGKSSLLRYIFTEYNAREEYVCKILPSPNYISDFAFLKAISAEYGLGPRRSVLDQENDLRGKLVEMHRENKSAVVFIDEAQKLKGAQLELLRTLLNFETHEHKLINFVIAGQMELAAKLSDPSKEAIRSRIFLPSSLDPLTLPEAKGMIEFRCQKAEIPCPFDADAIAEIYNQTGGIPREILKVCSFAHALGQRQKLKLYPVELVALAAKEVAHGASQPAAAVAQPV